MLIAGGEVDTDTGDNVGDVTMNEDGSNCQLLMMGLMLMLDDNGGDDDDDDNE